MRTFLRPALVAALLLSATPVLAQEAESKALTINGSATLTSDYRYRGISQTDKDFAVQGGLTVSHTSGAYVGIWGSSVDDYIAGGSDQEIDVDFRIISASHQNLTSLVQQGKFRQDLFFRLHVIDVVLPPLRERGQDILLLADHFIQQVCDEWDLPVKSLSKAAQQFLLQQHFPGNVRELRNMVERAIAFCDETELQVEDLQNSISPPLCNQQRLNRNLLQPRLSMLRVSSMVNFQLKG